MTGSYGVRCLSVLLCGREDLCRGKAEVRAGIRGGETRQSQMRAVGISQPEQEQELEIQGAISGVWRCRGEGLAEAQWIRLGQAGRDLIVRAGHPGRGDSPVLMFSYVHFC